jgi:hypothetical protein
VKRRRRNREESATFVEGPFCLGPAAGYLRSAMARCILVVDDEPDLLELVRFNLDRADCRLR